MKTLFVAIIVFLAMVLVAVKLFVDESKLEKMLKNGKRKTKPA